jgi:hypothetical protein
VDRQIASIAPYNRADFIYLASNLWHEDGLGPFERMNALETRPFQLKYFFPGSIHVLCIKLGCFVVMFENT